MARQAKRERSAAGVRFGYSALNVLIRVSSASLKSRPQKRSLRLRSGQVKRYQRGRVALENAVSMAVSMRDGRRHPLSKAKRVVTPERH